jgi:hypothetical protein
MTGSVLQGICWGSFRSKTEDRPGIDHGHLEGISQGICRYREDQWGSEFLNLDSCRSVCRGICRDPKDIDLPLEDIDRHQEDICHPKDICHLKDICRPEVYICRRDSDQLVSLDGRTSRFLHY